MAIYTLSQNTGAILGPIAKVLGFLMNGIYIGLSKIGISNVAVTIIIFTIIIYLCLLPLTIKQQRFSRMTQIMNPEIQAVQKKYKGRKDQESQLKMNEETQAVYDKYGVSPTGSCVQMIIQLLILIPLYRVIYNVPGYISSIKEMFTDSVNGIMATTGYADTMQSFYETISDGNYAMKNISVDFTSDTETIKDSIIDVLYRCTNANWDSLQDLFPNAAHALSTCADQVNSVNNLFGMSIVYSPINVIRTNFSEGNYIFIILGVLIPVLALATQMLNIRLMPQANTGGNQQASQMKMMNYMMPFYSFILVFILPIGVGVYWITGSVVRTVQQLVINHHLDKMDVEQIIEKNQKKAEAKKKKREDKYKKVSQQTLVSSASMNTKNIENRPKTLAEKAASANAVSSSGGSKKSKAKIEDKSQDQAEPPKKYREGSLASKANLVNEYNNRNTKKK